jgi:hypothetical protein
MTMMKPLPPNTDANLSLRVKSSAYIDAYTCWLSRSRDEGHGFVGIDIVAFTTLDVVDREIGRW